MPEIVLTEEQARVLVESNDRVSVRDPSGDVLTTIDPLDVLALRNYREMRTKGLKCIPGARVREHLQKLQAEWDRTGGFDEAYAQDFLARLREQDGL